MNKLIIKILIINILISCNQKKNTDSVVLNGRGTTKIDSVKVKKEADILSPETKMLEYLSLHFNRVQDSIFLKKPDFMIGMKIILNIDL